MSANLLATGLSAVGSIIGGLGRSQQSKARARMLDIAARQARQEAGVQASLQLEESDRVGARAATLAAASGGGGLQGSAMTVIDDLARQGMYRARQTVRDGLTQSTSMQNDATTARRQAALELTSSFIEAGSTVLGGMAREAQERRGNGQRVPGWLSWAGR